YAHAVADGDQRLALEIDVAVDVAVRADVHDAVGVAQPGDARAGADLPAIEPQQLVAQYHAHAVVAEHTADQVHQVGAQQIAVAGDQRNAHTPLTAIGPRQRRIGPVRKRRGVGHVKFSVFSVGGLHKVRI